MKFRIMVLSSVSLHGKKSKFNLDCHLLYSIDTCGLCDKKVHECLQGTGSRGVISKCFRLPSLSHAGLS
jgi:hypothetical protein